VRTSDRPTIDFVIFRENTEGVYLGRGRIDGDQYIAEEVNTVKGVERIIRAAFEWAAARGKTRVTMSDKANAVPAHKVWQETFKRIAAAFPGIGAEHRYVDALAMELVREPERFEVIVTNNLYGDILSDLGAGLVGGLGLAASANLHPGRGGLFEPVHGSAPPLGGQGVANPTAAGLAVLERGGNAVDAAITAAAVLNVVEPPMTGIGGDMFAIVWSAKDRKLYGLNASGRAGSLMTRAALLAKGHATMPQQTVEDVTVPGALSGWDALLRRFGTVTLAQALAPAIGYAEQGFPVTPIISAEWSAEAVKLRRDEGARATYLVGGGRAPRPGEWFRNPDLARTLRLIADQGIGALYGGELGRRVAERVRALGGYLTLDDFKDHRP